MFKRFFGIVFGFDDELKEMQSRLNQMKDLCDKYAEDIGHWHTKSEKLEKELNSLKRELGDLKKPIEVQSAEITYRRPVLISKNEFKQIEIDVRTFIMPDFQMENTLRYKKLIYDGTQDLDELIPRIYHLAKTGYKYGKDTNYGFNEYAMFPFELKTALKYKKAGDCEDWANMIGSYLAAANIPRNRWLISFGKARAGFGHATVYAKDKTGIWRHLNSTKPEYESKHLSGFPTTKDKNDLPGIKTDGFWFSYNDFFALHEFESTEASASFKDSGLKVSIKVKK